MYFEHHYWGMHLFWWIFWMAIISALLFSPWPARPLGRRDTAIEVLRRRFAAGEITEEEYRRRLEVLDAEGAPRSEPAAGGERLHHT
jgi:putative membrane protein